MERYIFLENYTNYRGSEFKKGQIVYWKSGNTIVDEKGRYVFDKGSYAYNHFIKKIEDKNVEELNLRIILNGTNTIAILNEENGKYEKGIAKLNPVDKYDKNYGIMLAVKRALKIEEDLSEKVIKEDVKNKIDWKAFKNRRFSIKFKNFNELRDFLTFILRTKVIDVSDDDDFEGETIESMVNNWIHYANLRIITGKSFYVRHGYSSSFLICSQENHLNDEIEFSYDFIEKNEDKKSDKSAILLKDIPSEQLLSELSRRLEDSLK